MATEPINKLISDAFRNANTDIIENAIEQFKDNHKSTKWVSLFALDAQILTVIDTGKVDANIFELMNKYALTLDCMKQVVQADQNLQESFANHPQAFKVLVQYYIWEEHKNNNRDLTAASVQEGLKKLCGFEIGLPLIKKELEASKEIISGKAK